MSRYQTIQRDQVEIGMDVRITEFRYLDQERTVVITKGKVKNLSSSERSGILDGRPVKIVTSIHLPGVEVDLYRGAGWSPATIEKMLPDLPTTVGSVIKVAGRTAGYLVTGYDIDENVAYGWCWLDQVDPNEHLVPNHLLEDAEILFSA